jgi:hypothetical protein
MNIDKIWYVKHSKYMFPYCYECGKVFSVEVKLITRRISLIPNISVPVATNAASLSAIPEHFEPGPQARPEPGPHQARPRTLLDGRGQIS